MRDGHQSGGSTIHNIDRFFLFSTLIAHVWHHWMSSLFNIPLIMTKEANPMFGLYSKTRTGSLIITSPLHSAQGEPSISCHRVWAYGVIFSKVPPIVRTDFFITSLWFFNAHTLLHLNVSQWFCYYHWGYRSAIDDRQWDRNPGEEEREEHGLSSAVRVSAYT